LAVGLCSIGLGPVVASAAPPGTNTAIAVTTTADVVDAGDGLTSLREAVGQANATPGDDVIDLVRGATYVLDLACGDGTDDANLGGDLDSTDATGGLRINGNPGSDIRYYQYPTIQVPGGCPARALEQHGTQLLFLTGLIVTGGHPGLDAGGGDGGGVRSDDHLSISNVKLVENEAPVGRGGGAAAPHLETYASEVRGNQAGADLDGPVGGGVWAVALVDHYTHYFSNVTTGPDSLGGGIAATESVHTLNSWLIENSAAGGGGGVAAPDITLHDYTAVHDNRATGVLASGGGALGIDSGDGSVVRVDQDSSVRTNSATAEGGGIAADEVIVEERTYVGGNTAVDTDGASGRAPGGGGIAAAEVEIRQSWVNDNTVTASTPGGPARGGGIAADTVLLDQSTVSLNEATTGGGVHALELTSVNSTIVDNSAAGGRGGGVSTRPGDGSHLSLDHTTITGNRAGKGANLDAGGAFEVGRSIIGEPVGAGRNCSGQAPTSLRFNLVGVGGGCHLHARADRIRVSDLGLGWTSYIHFGDRPSRTPTTGAASIVTRGHCDATSDEDGHPRPQGRRCEAGAVEVR
jgi:hypothetical protein